MHYCIGDVHGCYDELMNLINKIEKQDDKAQFIFTGDFADRGPKVWETMEWAAEHLNPTGRFTSLIGNHDRLLFDWYFEWLEWYKKQPFFDRLFNRMDRSEEPKPDYDFYEVAEAHHALRDLSRNTGRILFSFPRTAAWKRKRTHILPKILCNRESVPQGNPGKTEWNLIVNRAVLIHSGNYFIFL